MAQCAFLRSCTLSRLGKMQKGVFRTIEVQKNFICEKSII